MSPKFIYVLSIVAVCIRSSQPVGIPEVVAHRREIMWEVVAHRREIMGEVVAHRREIMREVVAHRREIMPCMSQYELSKE